MPTYRFEWMEPRDGWQDIGQASADTGRDAFAGFRAKMELDPGEYRFRPTNANGWGYVTLAEGGEEIFHAGNP